MIQSMKRKYLIISFLFFFFCCIGYALPAKAATVEPVADQKIEFKATSLQENNGKKQLTVELWIHQIHFKGIDLRLSYDSTFLSPSDISTNQMIDVNDALTIPSCFQFENGFGGYLDMFALSQSQGELRTVFSILGADEITSTNSYLVEDATIGKQVQIDGSVLLGKMTFQVLKEGEITTSALSLKTGVTSPKTGIKININGTDSYENQSLFAFRLAIASDNANLSDLTTSFATLTEFTPETMNYTATLLTEEKDIRINAVIADDTATLKAKVPQVNEQGEIQYDENQKLIYQEIEITSGVDFVVPLNELGGETIVIPIIVTAEDGVTQKTYQLTIDRPYATIKGTIQLGENLRDSIQNSYGTYLKYIADITVYSAGNFEWEKIEIGEVSFTDLANLNKLKETKSNADDGSYEIKVVPGDYDLCIQRSGFLASVVKTITVQAGDVITLEKQVLQEGDSNQSGIIDLDDLVKAVNLNGASQEDSNYELSCDFGEKGFITIDDLVSITTNMDKTIEIITFVKNK